MDCAMTDGGTLEFDSDGVLSRELMKKLLYTTEHQMWTHITRLSLILWHAHVVLLFV